MNDNNSWEHPFQNGDKTEPVQSFEAFKIWVEMGNKRSLKAVAERMEKSHDTIKKYSCTWKWSERLQDKLSYENKIIHGKQLEQVITSLDIDSRRDILLQFVLGNIMSHLLNISVSLPDELMDKRSFNGKYEENPKFKFFERLINMYTQLENVHTKTQKKLIDYNNKCLTYQTFNSTDEYKELLKNGQRQYLDIVGKFSKEEGDNRSEFNLICGGKNLLMGKLYEPYNTQQKINGKNVEELEEQTEELKE